ncbi:MAG: polysaccharide biosynthesis C-terminal domain-containing protein [Saprospiraceae bacterium]|nr:polysaccharide biosynthesis C-terminal domain-containing protein [Saprospiraceae bacterium]
MNYLFRYYQSVKNDSAKGFQFFSICRQLVTFVGGVILAKSAYTNTEIGIYEVWMFLGLILSFAGLSGVLQAFLAQYGKIDRSEQNKFIFNVYVVIWLITGFLALMLLLFKKFIFTQVFGIESIPLLPFVLVFLLLHFNAVFAPYIGLAKNQSSFFIPYALFYLVGNILSILIPAVFGGDLNLLLTGLLVWAAIEQVVVLYLLGKEKVFALSSNLIRLVLSAALPLTLYAGAGLFAQIFDAWLVNYHFGNLSVFALFKYGAREIPGAIALSSAFSASMVVLLISNRAGGLERIKNGSSRFMHFFFPVSILLIFFSERLFGLLYNDFFEQSAAIFNAYLLIMVSRWIFPQAVLMSLGKHKEIFSISLIELICNILLSLWFVRLFGLVGIALGTVIAFWLEKVLMIFILRNKYGIKLKEYIDLKPWSIYSLLLLAVFVWKWWF